MSKNDKDKFGNRMKAYEQVTAGQKSLPYLPVCIRLDGRGFSKLTKHVPRPFCAELHSVMLKVTQKLVEESGARIGYTQSDEISLVLYNEEVNSELFFDGKYQKLCSVLASVATLEFDKWVRTIPGWNFGKPAYFDCRVWTVPNVTEAMNYLLWREMDATKNSVQMLAREYFSHKELMGKGRADQMDMLHSKGINWNDCAPGFKRGTYIMKEEYVMSEADINDKLNTLSPEKRQRALNSLNDTWLQRGASRTRLREVNVAPLKKLLAMTSDWGELLCPLPDTFIAQLSSDKGDEKVDHISKDEELIACYHIQE